MRKDVFSMMNWWCEKGIDGFRMDVISMISKKPGLPDGKLQPGRFTRIRAASTDPMCTNTFRK